MADLFDSVVPSGAMPPARETASARQKAILRHVRSCPVCLEKVRTLQRTIDGIVARANSEIVTVYHAENDAGHAGPDAEGGYPYPVNVQVLHGPSDAAVEGQTDRAAPAAGLRGLRRSARPLAALVALVLIVAGLASILRTTGSTVVGTNLGDVDKTLAGVKNIRIVVRDQNAGVTQEFWIARRSNSLVTKTGEDYVLYDLGHDRIRTLASQTAPRVSAQLSGLDPGKARRLMANCLRDLMTGVSPDTELRRAAGEIDGGVPEGLDVYELPSSPQAGDSPLRSFRLVYIDRATRLPQKMELYRYKRGEDRGDPVTTTIFTYPTGQEMDSAINALFPAP
jgi:hypothetical protein